MAWPKPDPGLGDALAKALEELPHERRVMFGCPAFFSGGQMFAGVFGDRVILRLPAHERQGLIDAGRAEVFAPLAGRVMREYAAVADPARLDPEGLDAWLVRAAAFARAQPAKKPGKKAKA